MKIVITLLSQMDIFTGVFIHLYFHWTGWSYTSQSTAMILRSSTIYVGTSCLYISYKYKCMISKSYLRLLLMAIEIANLHSRFDVMHNDMHDWLRNLNLEFSLVEMYTIYTKFEISFLSSRLILSFYSSATKSHSWILACLPTHYVYWIRNPIPEFSNLFLL